jgi:putative tricarboxylic transport membrane protein
MRHGQAGQYAVAGGVLFLGVAMAIGTLYLPEATGYAKVGPKLAPTIISAVLVLLGLVLFKEVLGGGFRDVDEEAEAQNPLNRKAFAWISAGLVLNGIIMVPAGFIIAGTVLFVFACKGFDSRRQVRDALVGFVIAAVTFSFFNYVLGLSLPQGVLGPILPG